MPEELERCWVEDWADDPRTHQPASWTDLGDVRELAYWQLRARRKWLDERGRWLANAEVPLDAQCRVIPFGVPRFRDAAAFARAVAARFGRPSVG